MKGEINLFAKRTGNDNPPYDDLSFRYLLDKSAQLHKLLEEEVEELDFAISDINAGELLDAVVDIGVYYYQYVSLLERAGFDYKKACELVCDNNHSKYTTSATLVMKWLQDCKAAGILTYYIFDTEVDGVKYYCLKDIITEKVKKPVDFVPVDISDCVPDRFKE